MNKLLLMKNAELFQGEKYLNKKRDYFEGWYFKNVNFQQGISFISGINIGDAGAKAFIQIITNNMSYFVNYNIKDFEFRYNPFYIRIGDNSFSKEDMNINIKKYFCLNYCNFKKGKRNYFL